MEEVTKILENIEAGDTLAAEGLLPAAYDELKRIAAYKMEAERDGHTLQKTALVHEAYLRLLKADGSEPHWNSRGHFFAAAAEAMRRVLIESVRRKKCQKRGSDVQHTTWDESKFQIAVPDDHLLAVNEAVTKLEAEDPQLATIVKLRYFSGLTIAETASALEIAPRTVTRQWKCARVWLLREMTEAE